MRRLVWKGDQLVLPPTTSMLGAFRGNLQEQKRRSLVSRADFLTKWGCTTGAVKKRRMWGKGFLQFL